MRLTANWTCPECGTQVPIHLAALAGADGNRIRLRVRFPDAALADAFAHAWSHQEVAP